MTPVLADTYSLASFFGCFLHRVNPIVLRMSMLQDTPEWLRGRPKLTDLPRWKPSPANTLVPASKLSPMEAAERMRFVVEEYEHGWSLTAEGFTFEDVKEAVHFKLSW